MFTPEKSFLDCLWILFMSQLFKDPVGTMKEIMSWLFEDSIVTAPWLKFDRTRSSSKIWGKKIKLPQIRLFL